jgi:hypothetical protein
MTDRVATLDDLLRAYIGGEQVPSQTTLSDGRIVQIDKQDADSLRLNVLESDGSASSLTVFRPAESPCAEYPADLPFLPRTQALLSGTETDFACIWVGVDGNRVLPTITQFLESTGWSPGSPKEAETDNKRTFHDKRGNSRLVMATPSGMVIVRQSQRTESS